MNVSTRLWLLFQSAARKSIVFSVAAQSDDGHKLAFIYLLMRVALKQRSALANG